MVRLKFVCAEEENLCIEKGFRMLVCFLAESAIQQIFYVAFWTKEPSKTLFI